MIIIVAWKRPPVDVWFSTPEAPDTICRVPVEIPVEVPEVVAEPLPFTVVATLPSGVVA